MHVILGFKETTPQHTVHVGSSRGIDLKLKLEDNEQIHNLTTDLMTRYDQNSNDNIEFDEFMQLYDEFFCDDEARARLRALKEDKFKSMAEIARIEEEKAIKK